MTDTVSGLVWLQRADCFGAMTWADANTTASQLKDGDCGLADGSVAGQWRLPTVAEWNAALARAVVLGCTTAGNAMPPALTNNDGTACYSDSPVGTGRTDHALTGAVLQLFWSGSTFENNPGMGWAASLAGGWTDGVGEDHLLRVWPVRRY